MNIHTLPWQRIVAILALSFLFSACNAASVQDEGRVRSNQISSTAQPAVPADTDAGDPERGAQLFTQSVGGMPSCSTCHALNDSQIVGPGIAGIAARAQSRQEGMSAAEYLYISIIEPGAYVVQGFQNVMPDIYERSLSEAQIRDLIAYLLTR
ncbi:cytochrome c [Anaerolineae bacterium CFX9]|nr:cytochrome c [Anaerolineae bacterium CFX9]